MASILAVLTSAPTSPAGQEALWLAEALLGQGHSLTVCCLQDAAVLGSARPPREAERALERFVTNGVQCVVLGDDLVLRGLQPADHSAVVDHAGLVALLAAEHDQVIGAL